MWSNPVLSHHSPACHSRAPAPSPLFLKLQFCEFTIPLVLVSLLMTPLLTQFCTHTHIGAHIGIYENSYKHKAYIHILIYTHVCTYHTHIHKCIYILTCIYTHIHMHIHTYTFTHICTQHTVYTDTYAHTSSFLWIRNSFKTGDLQLFYLSPQNFSSMMDIFVFRFVLP